MTTAQAIQKTDSITAPRHAAVEGLSADDDPRRWPGDLVDGLHRRLPRP